MVLDTSNEAKTLEILREHQLEGIIKNGKIIVPLISKDHIAKLNEHLVQSGVLVYEMSVIKNDLETIFMELINN